MIRYPLYIFDLDGTLYRGNEPIPNAAETVRTLRRDGSKIRYLTNNSGQKREFFLEKLSRMGFPVELDEIMSSGIGAATYLKSKGHHSVFVVGEPGLVATLREDGLDVANAPLDGAVTPEGTTSDAVLAGICKTFTYDLMAAAMLRIRSGQAFVATNSDSTYPMEGDRLIPGAGTIVQAIQTCSEKTAHVVGKPNAYLVTLVLKEAGCSPDQTLVVGDRMDTDIASGIAAGCPTHLVLSGVTHKAPEAQASSNDISALM